MLDITVGMTGLCFRERLIHSFFRGERTNLCFCLQDSSDLSLASDRDRFGETAPSRGKCIGVSDGTVITTSRALAYFIPRGLASWEWRVADCLSASDSSHC